MLKRPKLSSDIGLITIKSNIKLSEKYSRNFFMTLVVWMIIQALMIRILFFSSNMRHIRNLKRGKILAVPTFTHQVLMRKTVLVLSYPIYENHTINYEGIFAQFQFYQLFNYQFIRVCVLVYVCVYIFVRFIFKILGQARFL